MTALTGKEIEQRLDYPQFLDAYLAGHAVTIAIFTLAGWGVVWGALAGVLAGVLSVFYIAIATALLSGNHPIAFKSRLVAGAIFSAGVAWSSAAYIGLAGVIVGAAAFVGLTAQVVRRHHNLPPDLVVLPNPAPPRGELPSSPSLPGPVGIAYAQLPELSADLRARVDAAIEDYRQLQDILHDPLLLIHAAVDAPGMLAAAEEVALDLLRQVPRLARIQALAARRSHDEQARAAATAALKSLDRQADALHEAASAAFIIIAAGPESDTQALREHTDRLHSLRAVHDELQTY